MSIQMAGGCVCHDCHQIQKLQDIIMTPGQPNIIERPEGEREQWIEPKTSGNEEGPVA